MDFSESSSVPLTISDEIISGSLSTPKSTISMQTMTVSADSPTDEHVAIIPPKTAKTEKPETVVCSSTDEVQEVKPSNYHVTSRGRQ